MIYPYYTILLCIVLTFSSALHTFERTSAQEKETSLFIIPDYLTGTQSFNLQDWINSIPSASSLPKYVTVQWPDTKNFIIDLTTGNKNLKKFIDSLCARQKVQLKNLLKVQDSYLEHAYLIAFGLFYGFSIEKYVTNIKKHLRQGSSLSFIEIGMNTNYFNNNAIVPYLLSEINKFQTNKYDFLKELNLNTIDNNESTVMSLLLSGLLKLYKPFAELHELYEFGHFCYLSVASTLLNSSCTQISSKMNAIMEAYFPEGIRSALYNFERDHKGLTLFNYTIWISKELNSLAKAVKNKNVEQCITSSKIIFCISQEYYALRNNIEEIYKKLNGDTASFNSWSAIEKKYDALTHVNQKISVFISNHQDQTTDEVMTCTHTVAFDNYNNEYLVKETPRYLEIKKKYQAKGTTIILYKIPEKYLAKEIIYPFEYTPNVLEWYENPEQALINQGYTSQKNKKSRLTNTGNFTPIQLHAFIKVADLYFHQCATCTSIKNNQNQTILLYAIAGSMSDSNGINRPGLFTWLFDGNKCFHHFFEQDLEVPLVKQLFDQGYFAPDNSIFYQLAFPPLSSLKK